MNDANSYLTIFFLVAYSIIGIIVAITAEIKNNKKPIIKQKTQVAPQPLNREYKGKSCLTNTEMFFYRHLRKLVKDEYKIDPQVLISSIINANNYSNWNKINRKTVDFVIRNENLNTVFAIELDDRYHERPDRIKRDNFVNQVFQDAGIPLIHIKTSSSYENEIKNKVPKFLLKE